MTKPANVYVHPECQHCLFLGGFMEKPPGARQYFDLYFCTYSQSVIARYGDNGAEYYHSENGVFSSRDCIFEGRRRAAHYLRAIEEKESKTVSSVIPPVTLRISMPLGAAIPRSE